MGVLRQVLDDLRAGKMVIVTDDESRENEGDFIMAAEKVTPEAVNFMRTHGRGMVNLCITKEIAGRLKLDPMVVDNTARRGTNFTVSIDARDDTTTGSSVYDQARTMQAVLDPHTKAEDILRPGHVLPLVAHQQGVIGRPGHTEAAVDLARLAGLGDAGVLCEIMDSDGRMARVDALKRLAHTHGLTMITVADIIEHRLATELLVERVATTILPTSYGTFVTHVYHDMVKEQEHLALVMGGEEVIKSQSHKVTKSGEQLLVRIHSSCLTGDVFGSLRCDCHQQLKRSMEEISVAGCGIIMYLDQEGRGIGLTNKLKAYTLQDAGLDTVEANVQLGLRPDERRFWISAHILKDLGVTHIQLMTNNPRKVEELQRCGIVVERKAMWTEAGEYNQKYVQVKKDKLGHLE